MDSVETNILLETGTNELEILEFLIAGNSFGINVAKITELMQAQPIQQMPNSHPCIEGIINPRGMVYTVIHLAGYLGLYESENPEKDIYIITSFNKMNVAFHVHGVVGINRVSWQAIEKPDPIIYGGGEGIVTGIAKVGDRIISILDFEKIAFDICPETGFHPDEVRKFILNQESDAPILIAEDSALIRKLLQDALSQAGYNNLIVMTNGEEAWRYLQRAKENNEVPLKSQVCCVITDIEMPQMDGHRLTKMIKNDSVLNVLPVVIFSSLIDETMMLKGLEVGADAQLSKPEIGHLVGIINKFTEDQPRHPHQE
ncbi:MAG: chemotaxis protein [Oscillospiraceae bacterium]|nr:chemotaxis protein [Oscillospiraceae bacterium]